MNLDDLTITWFCLLDDLLPSVTENQRLRQRGRNPCWLIVKSSPWRSLGCTWA